MVTFCAAKTKDFRQKTSGFGTKRERPSYGLSLFAALSTSLELTPEKLVIYIMMELHLAALHDGSEKTRAPVG